MGLITRVGGAVALMAVAMAGIGCGSYSSFQTASVLEKGKSQFGGSVMFIPVSLDVEYRYGFGSGLEGGLQSGLSRTIGGDVKWQFLKESGAGRGGAPFSAAIDLGAGTGSFANYYFGQVIFSKKFNKEAEGYFSYRYQMLDVDTGGDDDSFTSELAEDINKTDIKLHHAMFGVEFNAGHGWYVTPELSYVFGDDVVNPFIAGGIGFGKRF